MAVKLKTLQSHGCSSQLRRTTRALDLAYAFFLKLSRKFSIIRWRGWFWVRQTSNANRWAVPFFSFLFFLQNICVLVNSRAVFPAKLKHAQLLFFASAFWAGSLFQQAQPLAVFCPGSSFSFFSLQVVLPAGCFVRKVGFRSDFLRSLSLF